MEGGTTKDYDDIIELRSIISDFVKVANYKSHLTWHTERDAYDRIAKQLKETLVTKLKDSIRDNDIITECLDEIYQDEANHRAVQLGQLAEALFKAQAALDDAQGQLRDLKKEL